jgi:hypothetical protein
MVSKLLAVWRTVHLLLYIAAAALAWHGFKVFQDAAAASSPKSAASVAASTATVALDDTLVFDLSHAGLGQDDLFGWKGEEYAVIPAHPVGDTAHTLVILSSDPSHLGPVLQTFLVHQSASLDGQDLRVSSSAKDDGNAQIQARAMIETLSERFKDHLHDPLVRREAVRGVGRLRNAQEFPQLDGIEGNVVAIRSGYLPDTSKAAAVLAGAVLLAALNVLTWLWDRRRLAERAQAEADEPADAPLV